MQTKEMDLKALMLYSRLELESMKFRKKNLEIVIKGLKPMDSDVARLFLSTAQDSLKSTRLLLKELKKTLKSAK